MVIRKKRLFICRYVAASQVHGLESWESDRCTEHVFNYSHVEEYLFFETSSVFLFVFMTKGERRNWPFCALRFRDPLHFHFLILPSAVLYIRGTGPVGCPYASQCIAFPAATRRSIQIRLRLRRKDFLFPQKLSRWQVIDRRLTCLAFETNVRATRFLTAIVEQLDCARSHEHW